MPVLAASRPGVPEPVVWVPLVLAGVVAGPVPAGRGRGRGDVGDGGVGVTGFRSVGRAEARAAAAAVAAELGVTADYTMPLARHGVARVSDMATWSMGDLEDVHFVGASRLRVLVPALRAAGVPLPVDDPLRVVW